VKIVCISIPQQVVEGNGSRQQSGDFFGIFEEPPAAGLASGMEAALPTLLWCCGSGEKRITRALLHIERFLSGATSEPRLLVTY